LKLDVDSAKLQTSPSAQSRKLRLDGVKGGKLCKRRYRFVYMTPQKKVESFKNIFEYLRTLIGNRLQVRESITDRGNYDRHGTTFNLFSFELVEVSFRLSGARIILSGKNEEQYEIGMDIISSSIMDKEIIVEEKLAIEDSKVRRHSRIVIKADINERI
jgi:hypothetical protein